ncbi:MAG: CotH kinase family protein [Clostridium sp.]
MISNKYINIIIAIIMTLSMIFAGILVAIDTSTYDSNNSSEITQPEYITELFNKDEVMEINIDIDEELWNELINNAMSEEYYNANITVNGETYYNVGLRAKGNTTLSQIASDDTTDRYSFKVKFDEYINEQTLKGLEKLALNNMMQDTTYMKEYLSYDLLNKMGISTPAFQYANITLNGEPWGLYLAIEVMEESYIERYYGSSKGNLYKPETTNLAGADRVNIGAIGGIDEPNKNTINFQDEDRNKDIGMPNDEVNKNNKEFNNEENLKSPPPKPEMGNGTQGQDMDGINGPPGQNSEDKNDNVPNMQQDKPMNGAMGRNVGGADLVYSGDEQSNYSTIFEGAIFNHTSEEDYDRVIAMIKSLNEDIDNIEQYLDVDEVLRYFAVNTFLVNLDSYVCNMKHNYYLYEQEGVFSILPWDYNLSFGGFQSGSASNAINFPIDNPVSDSLESSPLIGKLLEVEKYKEMYHKYLNEIVENYINSGVFTNTVSDIDKLIGEYVKNDATAFYTYDEYTASISELITFGIDRAKSISAQLEGTQPTTSTGNISTNLNLAALGSQGGGDRVGNKGEIPDENMPKDFNMENAKEDNREKSFSPQDTYGDTSIKSSLITYAISTGGIIIALLIVLNFKRKKYHI